MLERLNRFGVVGAGGAGFPAGKKLDCKAEDFLINGVECEPLLDTDQFIMRTRPKTVVRGIEVARQQVGVRRAILILKRSYTKEINSLAQAIEDLGARIDIKLVDSFYPAGDEHVLVYQALGKTVPPGGIPIQVGAVVSNVGTMAWVADAMEGRPVTRKFVTVAGETRDSRILDVPIGTPIAACIEAVGGTRIPDAWVILGGPMMGRYLSVEEAEDEVVTKTTGGILLVDPTLPSVTRKRLTTQQIITRAKSVCIQCSRCTDMCPRHLIGHPLHPHKLMRQMVWLGDLGAEEMAEALICSECGVCEDYACPMGLSPRQINIQIKAELRAKGVKYAADNAVISPSTMWDYRRVPTARLLYRLGVATYSTPTGDEALSLKPDTVSIPLKQHIGAPASVVVQVGDRVECGQTIGQVSSEILGADIHASMEGVVVSVDGSVVIERERR